jgi:hypothetical protein
MDSNPSADPIEVIHRLFAAGNAHDLPRFVAFFASDYLSEQPNHPNRAFRGRAQVEKNWSATFREIPDIRLEILDQAVHGSQVWFESDWSGTFEDQSRFHWRGVSIFTVEGGEITAGRLYMEPVEESGLDIDATVKEMTRG